MVWFLESIIGVEATSDLSGSCVGCAKNDAFCPNVDDSDPFNDVIAAQKGNSNIISMSQLFNWNSFPLINPVCISAPDNI